MLPRFLDYVCDMHYENPVKNIIYFMSFSAKE
jgi:hypothetical protein